MSCLLHVEYSECGPDTDQTSHTPQHNIISCNTHSFNSTDNYSSCSTEILRTWLQIFSIMSGNNNNNSNNDAMTGAGAEISSKIAAQGDLVRQLKSDKKPKEEIEAAVKILLSLKVNFINDVVVQIFIFYDLTAMCAPVQRLCICRRELHRNVCLFYEYLLFIFRYRLNSRQLQDPTGSPLVELNQNQKNKRRQQRKLNPKKR